MVHEGLEHFLRRVDAQSLVAERGEKAHTCVVAVREYISPTPAARHDGHRRLRRQTQV